MRSHFCTAEKSFSHSSPCPCKFPQYHDLIVLLIAKLLESFESCNCYNFPFTLILTHENNQLTPFKKHLPTSKTSLSKRSSEDGDDLTELVNHAVFYYSGDLCTDPEEDGRCKMQINFQEPVTKVSQVKLG